MKKILSILLALILCLGMLISCGNEENSSSQGEYSSVCSSESSAWEPKINKIKTEYSFERCYLKEDKFNEHLYNAFDRFVFAEYSDYLNFVNDGNISDSDNITQELFNENFIIAVYQDGYKSRENERYGDFEKQTDSCRLVLEFTNYTNVPEEDQEIWPVFDLIIIPRTLCAEISSNMEISLVIWEHNYEFREHIYH